ncbi:MAG: GIY-YIG nuclease family protein [Acidobacteriota bacterium]
MKNRYDMREMKDRIHDFIETHGGIVSSVALVKGLLKAHYDSEEAARRIVFSLLKGDNRFKYLEAAGWTVAEDRMKLVPLSERLFVVFAANISESGRWRGMICEASFIKIKNGKEAGSFHIDMPAENSGMQPGIKIKDARRILRFLEDGIVAFSEPLSTFRQLQMELGNKTGEFPGNESISIKKVMGNLFRLKRNAGIEEAARVLGISLLAGSSARIKAKGATEILLILLEDLAESGIKSFSDLKRLEERRGENVDFSKFDFDRAFLDGIPETPGVYRFLDEENRPVYVGRAKNLNRRISSYFWSFATRPEKITSLHRSIRKIYFEETGSELEAILREAEMIRLLRPPMNAQFEVHERGARYGKRGNMVIILPGVSRKEAILYFLKDGSLIKKVEFREKIDLQEIECLLRSAFFSRRKASGAGKTGIVSEDGAIRAKRRYERKLVGVCSDKAVELISSYLMKNRDSVNWFDPTDYKDSHEALKIIELHLKDSLEERERIIHR